MACEAPAVTLGLGADLQGVSGSWTLGRASQQVKIICKERSCLSQAVDSASLGMSREVSRNAPYGPGSRKSTPTELLRLLGQSTTGWWPIHQNLSSHSSGGWKAEIGVSAGLVPPEGSEGRIFPGPPLGLAGGHSSCSHASALCACVLQTSPDFTDVSHIGLEATSMTSF